MSFFVSDERRKGRIQGRMEAADLIAKPYIALLRDVERLEKENAEFLAALESAKEQMMEAGLFNGLVAAACRKNKT